MLYYVIYFFNVIVIFPSVAGGGVSIQFEFRFPHRVGRGD